MTIIRLSADTSTATGKAGKAETLVHHHPTFFISDLHLDPARPETIELSLRFFTSVHGAQALFIIGDLFEYWLGDDAADPRLNAVYDAISAVSASGTAVHLMHGNRDFLLGEQFASRVGAQLHRDDHVQVDFGNVHFSLLHGDTLCTDDVGYQQLRTMVRNPQWQQEFLALSIDERIAQAQALREKSREAVAEKVAGIMDVNNAAVAKHCNAFANDCLIHGHTHRPHDHVLHGDVSTVDTASENRLSTPRRLVLGDWKSDHAMIARFDGEQLQLERFS